MFERWKEKAGSTAERRYRPLGDSGDRATPSRISTRSSCGEVLAVRSSRPSVHHPSPQGGCRDRRDRDRDSQSACPAGLGHAGDTVPRDRDTPATLFRGTGTRRRHCPAGRGTKWDACGTHCGFSNIGDRLGPFGRCPHRRTLIQHQYHAKCRFRGLLHSEMSKHGGFLANLKIFSHFRGRQTFFEQ